MIGFEGLAINRQSRNESESENVSRKRDWGHVLITAFPVPARSLINTVRPTVAGPGGGSPLNAGLQRLTLRQIPSGMCLFHQTLPSLPAFSCIPFFLVARLPLTRVWM